MNFRVIVVRCFVTSTVEIALDVTLVDIPSLLYFKTLRIAQTTTLIRMIGWQRQKV
jgi:hypothetical protein